MEEREYLRRAAASHNQEQYLYEDYNCKEEEKQTADNKERQIMYAKLAQNNLTPTPFHSAMNPLDYYNEENDKYGENKFKKLAGGAQWEGGLNPGDKFSPDHNENEIEYSEDSNKNRTKVMAHSHSEEQPSQDLIQAEADKIMNDMSQEMDWRNNAKYQTE